MAFATQGPSCIAAITLHTTPPEIYMKIRLSRPPLLCMCRKHNRAQWCQARSACAKNNGVPPTPTHFPHTNTSRSATTPSHARKRRLLDKRPHSNKSHCDQRRRELISILQTSNVHTSLLTAPSPLSSTVHQKAPSPRALPHAANTKPY